MSLDGYVAGPSQRLDDPIGEGGMRLHEWIFVTDSWRKQHGSEGGERSADSEVVEEVTRGVGAYIMSRKMFGGGDGPWDESWRGRGGGGPPPPTPAHGLPHPPRAPPPPPRGTTPTAVTHRGAPAR